MTKYTVRRVCMAFVTLLLVASITFFLMNAIPGNPWLSEKTPSEATIQALNAKYGLDQPKTTIRVHYTEEQEVEADDTTTADTSSDSTADSAASDSTATSSSSETTTVTVEIDLVL